MLKYIKGCRSAQVLTGSHIYTVKRMRESVIMRVQNEVYGDRASKQNEHENAAVWRMTIEQRGTQISKLEDEQVKAVL